MKALVLLLTICFLAVLPLSAQEATPTYRTETRCITQPTPKPEGWTFEGTIFTYSSGFGLHGFRADYPTRYYVAFSANNEAAYGSFSPDGRYFVVDRFEQQDTNSLDVVGTLDGMFIYSTAPDREPLVVPMPAGLTSRAHFLVEFYNLQRWLSDTEISYSSTDDGGIIRHYAYDMSTGETRSITRHEAQTPAADYRDMTVSFDGRYSVKPFDPYGSTLHVLDREMNIDYDTCLTPDFVQIAFSPTAEQFAFGMEAAGGFVYIFDLDDWAIYALNLQAHDVVGWYPSY